MRYLLGILLGLALSSAAVAANLAPPASPLLSGYPSTSGWYWGLNTEVGGGAANGVNQGIAQANTGAIFEAQADLGLTIGYLLGTSPVAFYAVEASFDWSNLNSQSQGFSLTGPFVGEQIVKAGTPLANILSLLPNFGFQFPGLPTLPAGVTAGPPHMYLAAGVREQDVSANFGVSTGKGWLIAPEVGAGILAQLSNNAAIDVRIMYVAPSGGLCVNNGAAQSCGGLGQGVLSKVSILW